jgi:N-acyl-L-homoserine lactone synthetase
MKAVGGAELTALEKVDALAAQALDWLSPVRFATATTDAEREATYRLRYQAVVERGWLQEQDLPGGVEQDDYDDKAIHLIAWDGSAAIATCRLVLPEPGTRLPTEAAFDLNIEPAGTVVDAGRFVVSRKYSSLEHRVLACLLARAWLEIRLAGYSRACAAFASRAMIRIYKGMGFRVKILGQPRFYWGVERLPVLFDVAESMPALIENWLPKTDQG